MHVWQDSPCCYRLAVHSAQATDLLQWLRCCQSRLVHSPLAKPSYLAQVAIQDPEHCSSSSSSSTHQHQQSPTATPSASLLQDLAHPWARAFDRNITEHVASATDWLLQRAAPLLPGDLAKRARRAVMQAANWATTPLLDHTSW